MTSLLANLSSIAIGGESLADPADALRNVLAVSAVLEYAPEPKSDDELADIHELQVGL